MNTYKLYLQTSKFFFSSLPDYAVPGPAEVPPRSEKEVSLRGSYASPAGSILHRCTPPTALHHRDENEEHVNAGKEQRRRRRDYLCTGAWVRGNENSCMCKTLVS